jgi:hypothetical protein
MALPDQFVNRYGDRSQQLFDLAASAIDLRCDRRRVDLGEEIAGLGRRLEGPDHAFQGLDHVLRAFHQHRALAQQVVTAARPGIERRARHGKDFAALLERVARRDERTRPSGRLDHQHAERHAGNQAVAAGKVPCLRHRGRRHLRNQQPPGQDFAIERLVLRRVDHVEAAGHNGHGAGFQGADVGRRVDPARHARGHDEARRAQPGRQIARQAPAVGRGVARADHGDGLALQEAEITQS